jgi:hypothetical protein
MQSVRQCLETVASNLFYRYRVRHYPREIEKWQEVPLPAYQWKDNNIWEGWRSAIRRSRYWWHVSEEIDQIHAYLRNQRTLQNTQPKRPAFKWPGPADANVCVFPLEDGSWLVGFDAGEFGGGLYWYNEDGSQHYKISEGPYPYPIYRFFQIGETIYALEGMAHMDTDEGALLRIFRLSSRETWQVETVKKLFSCPVTAHIGKDNDVFIALYKAIVKIKMGSPDYPIQTVCYWPWPYPYSFTSFVQSRDGSRLIIGLKQFVAEIDLTDGTTVPTAPRLLVPSRAFLSWRLRYVERRLNTQKPAKQDEHT